LPVPAVDPEGRDVVFSGQLLGQMLVASDMAARSSSESAPKDAKSIHAVFARAGSYRSPFDLTVEALQAGRTWASDTVTGWQDGKLMARATVLMSIDEPDLMRHQIEMPQVPSADQLPSGGAQAFPGADLRMVPLEDSPQPGGAPWQYAWHRHETSVPTVAAAQAVLSWATCGDIIGLNMRPHADTVDLREAHRSISTGVIGHTINFHERFDAAEWLLIAQEGTYAGRGRVHGRGEVYAEDGRLVATFSQDSMARAIQGELDPKRSM
jgi:acyl-CoA thioesterase II